MSSQGQGGIHLAMAVVPEHGYRIGVPYRLHFLKRDITRLAKCPPEKQTCSHRAVETLCIDTS